MGKLFVNTIGSKVRTLFQQTIEINKSLFGDNFSNIVFCPVDRPIIYYSRESGVNREYWNKITDVKYGLGNRTIHNIFHKRDSNEKGQKYSAECKYRFAMVLGYRRFFGSNKNIAILE